MISTLLCLSLMLPTADVADDSESVPPRVIVVVGAGGTSEYAAAFEEWTGRWEKVSQQAAAEFVRIGALPGQPASLSDREQLQTTLEETPASPTSKLYLVLIGHGTFDGMTAKFNLTGPDISGADLAEWLKTVDRPTAVINCTSASGPFLSALSAPNRLVVTATRSGREVNFARFGEALSHTIGDPDADIDRDGQTSLLEAVLRANRRVTEFYELEGRLATEHPLIDDNGDGRGTPLEWFRGIRPDATAAKGVPCDGARLHQWHLVKSPAELRLPPEVRSRRDGLELELIRLREQKSQLMEDAYYGALETTLLELARLYEEHEFASNAIKPPAGN